MQRAARRISATYKDLPGGQVLGPTFDYTHRLLDFALAADGPAPRRRAAPRPQADRRADAARRPRCWRSEGLIAARGRRRDAEPGDLTREPLAFPADRARAAAGAGARRRGLPARRSAIRRSAATRNAHPFVGEIRVGDVAVEIRARRSSASRSRSATSASPNARWSTSSTAAATEPPQFTRGYGLVFGHGERKAMAMALVDRALRADELGEDVDGAGAGARSSCCSHCDNVEATGFVEHLKLPHYVDFQSRARERAHDARSAAAAPPRRRPRNDRRIDASRLQLRLSRRATKRMIRRAILKAVAIPGHQVPFGSREMPLPYGWGTGGIQVTAAIIGPDDVLKVIDQGADDTTNAVSIRRFFAPRRRRARPPSARREATIIQTRHRIPETPLREGQILVYQVPHARAAVPAGAARRRDASACTRWPITA